MAADDPIESLNEDPLARQPEAPAPAPHATAGASDLSDILTHSGCIVPELVELP